MANCPNCGVEIKEDDRYCTSCGASVTAAREKPARREARRARERDECFGGPEEGDRTGLISFGFFIIIVGIVFTLNTGIFSDFGSWFEQMSAQKDFVRPPDDLISSAALFFGLIGASNFVMAGIRLAAGQAKRRALSDTLSGVALVLFAYLVNLYGTRSIEWQRVFAIEAVAVGLLIVLYTLVRYALLKSR